jgi:hypothetical protein
MQETPKNQHKKPIGILDASCVGIAKSPDKNQLVLGGFNMGIARNAQKLASILITPCGYCNVSQKN